MRETSLTRGAGGAGPERIRILTGDRGTEVLDAEGRVVREFGTDRHAEQVARHEAEGWRVARTRHRRPPGAAGTPPRPHGAEASGAQEATMPRPDQEAG
jgi:hypothetical protein